MTPDPTIETLLSSNPDIMSGRTVFRGTRVPIEAVLVNLNAGLSLEEVLDDFPTLDRKDVLAVLTLMGDAARVARAA